MTRTATHATSHKTGHRARSSSSTDAIAILKADHAKVLRMFEEFKVIKDNAEKEALAELICSELTVHTIIEEEILYPAARDAWISNDLLDEAEVEHASAKDLIAQIEEGSPGDDKWEAKVQVLGEYIDHHVSEEQTELFPKLRKTDLDLEQLGKELTARKQQLVSSIADDEKRAARSR